MVGHKSMFLLIALSSFLVAFTNGQDDCSKYNTSCTITFNFPDSTDNCCVNETNPQACFYTFLNANDFINETNPEINGTCQTVCTQGSDCPEGYSCELEFGEFAVSQEL